MLINKFSFPSPKFINKLATAPTPNAIKIFKK